MSAVHIMSITAEGGRTLCGLTSVPDNDSWVGDHAAEAVGATCTDCVIEWARLQRITVPAARRTAQHVFDVLEPPKPILEVNRGADGQFDVVINYTLEQLEEDMRHSPCGVKRLAVEILRLRARVKELEQYFGKVDERIGQVEDAARALERTLRASR